MLAAPASWLRILAFRRFVRRGKSGGLRSGERLRRRLPLRISAAPQESPDAETLPRIIWIYWHAGEAEAPELARICIDSWRRRNPGWDVRVLSDAVLAEAADVSDVAALMSIPALSDIIRLRLLRDHGGVWADATAFCGRPLDEWLPQALSAGFFAFHNPPGHPNRLISSWFLAAPPGAPLVVAWERLATEYWRMGRRADAYYWVHYLFEWMLLRDAALYRIWRRMPTVGAEAAHYLQRALNDEEKHSFPPLKDCHRVLAEAALAGGFPVHKLTYKIKDIAPRLRVVLERSAGPNPPPG